jgi:uncharacterized protein (TIGR02246 family)
MITLNKTKMLFGLVVSLALCAALPATATPGADVAAMHAMEQAFVTAYNSGDVATAAALYAEDAVLLPPNAPSASGRSAIHAYLEKDVAESAKAGVKLSISPKADGGVSGNMGWTSGTYSAKDKSGHIVEAGKFLSVFRKKDGKWLYLRDTWNTDSPPASAQPSAPTKQ